MYLTYTNLYTVPERKHSHTHTHTHTDQSIVGNEPKQLRWQFQHPVNSSIHGTYSLRYS